MSPGKKKYLYSDAPFTDYAKRKIKTHIKQEKVTVTEVSAENRHVFDDEQHEMSSNDEETNVPMSIASEVQEFSHVINEGQDDYEYSSDEEMLKILEEIDADSNNINKLFDESNFFESVSINVNRSPAELLLMALRFALSTQLSVTGILGLLKFVNRICSKSVVPETKYQLDKLCNNENTFTLHAVCTTCSMCLGTFEEFDKSFKCENCNTLIDVSNPSNSCYFATINPSNSVRDYLHLHENYYDDVVSHRIHETNLIKDIYDGESYRQFLNKLNDYDRKAYVTAIFNTDGAPVFESSNLSIWPIYIMLNEIPIENRFSSTIVVGLWFGTNKPEMSVFLNAFVEDMNHLSTVGISTIIKTEERLIKLFPIVACVDTVARAPMNGTTNFNGYYGCDWCEHPGQYYGGSMRYPFIIPPPAERTRQSMIEHATEAVSTQARVFGVKNASPLLTLRNFDIIDGFTPDYMHCFLAGVASQFTEYILQRLTINDLEYMNKLLISIKASHVVGRLSRPLSQRSKWKAREWENWLLYYSIPVLTTVLLDKRILQHWALLVESLWICLGTEISYSELNRANEMLYKFVSEVEDIYSLQAMTYNVHQLLHIVKSVHNWGPLWAHSAFPFESANHKLLTAIHSAKGVILQIVRYTNIQRTVQFLEKKLYSDSSKIVQHFCQHVTSPQTRKTLKLSNVTYFGKGKSIPMNLIHFNVPTTTLIFSKMVLNGCLYATSEKVNKRSCNYYAQLSDGSFIKILYFLVDTNSKMEKTVCQILKTRHNRYASVVKEATHISEEICIDTNLITKSCIFIETKDATYITSVPNTISH